MLTLQRIIDLSNGAQPEEGEAQMLAMGLVNIFSALPHPVGYRWRWKEHVRGCAQDWHFSEFPLSHPDIECRFVFDGPYPPDMNITFPGG
ncbi:TPA: hypothetical protein ACYEKW_004881, partial [Escherichia coli]